MLFGNARWVATAFCIGLASALPARAMTDPALLPPTLQSGPVTYTSGGSSREQELAMERAASEYPLELHFLADGPAYALAYVPVTIKDASGRVVLQTSAAGPLMLANLPDGRYTVTARYEGRGETLHVDVDHSEHQTLAFDWKY